MQTLKVSVSLPDNTHPDIAPHLSANDPDCDVVIALPLGQRNKPLAVADAGSRNAASTAGDGYVLGGYAGI